MHVVLEGLSGRNQLEVPPSGAHRTYASRTRSGHTGDRRLEGCLCDGEESWDETKERNSQRRHRAEFRLRFRWGIGLEVPKNDDDRWKGEDPCIQGTYFALRIEYLLLKIPLAPPSGCCQTMGVLKCRQARKRRCLPVEQLEASSRVIVVTGSKQRQR